MKSVMKHKFSEVPKADIPRSSFNRSHAYKTMFDVDKLIPIYVDEVLPGDTHKINGTYFARLSSALTVPVMDNLYMDTFWFFVPARLVWENWKKFMGEQDNPSDSIAFTIPQVVAHASQGFQVGELFDYMGCPTEINSLSVNALPSRCYNLIYNEWFRDQNLQNSEVVDVDNGPDDETDYKILTRGKRHDYFTSCLPWPQKGTAVPLPLTGDAPVTGFGKQTQVFTAGPKTDIYESGGSGTTSYADYQWVDGGNNDYWNVTEEDPNNAGFLNIRADLSGATAATINELREAFQLQKLLERDARGGTRYTEIVKAHFNVTSPDARQQRPEFLGGKTIPVSINPVQQTSVTTAETPQGNQAAYGTIGGSGDGFTKSFTEHGYIIGMVNIRADLTYQQGLDKLWSRSTKHDFYWPALAHIGEQAVLNKEIYAQNDANDILVFGYQERYAEYRYKQSHITGKLRSTYTTPLDLWHLSEEFGSLPTLSSAFIKSAVPINRVLAVTDEPDFVFDSYMQVTTVRPMPTYGVPGLIDHF